MADKTKIEWADATLNYINGCSLASPGCTNCYAMKQAHRFPVRQGLTVQTKGGMVWTGEVRANEKALHQALAWKRGRRIFWNAHGDLFHAKVPDAWIDRQFAVMAMTGQHIHMVLTKRSDRMRAYLAHYDFRRRVSAVIHSWPADQIGHGNEFTGDFNLAFRPALPNVWLGVSVEDQKRRDERVPDLVACAAARRFVSYEPALGPVDWGGAKIDLIIAGGESGPGSRPAHPDWFRQTRDQCAAAGMAFFFKQHGDWIALAQNDGRAWKTDGTHFCRLRPDGSRGDDGWPMQKVGKRHAGNLLDGRQHLELPQ
jgi:protein gp37